jgi:hypothetical protein
MNRLGRFLTGDSRSLGYNLYRFASSLLYYGAYRPLFPNTPNFTPSASRRIERLLEKGMTVFEWGSGRSTPWFADRVDRLVSVEHSPEWYEKGREKLAKLGIRNVELILVTPSVETDFSWERDWPFFGLLGHAPGGAEYIGYMRAIDRFQDGSFDCVCIDGRARVGCLPHAVSKLAWNGFIILDDSQRPRYGEFFDLLRDWSVEHHGFGLRRTTLFWRPGTRIPD